MQPQTHDRGGGQRGLRCDRSSVAPRTVPKRARAGRDESDEHLMPARRRRLLLSLLAIPLYAGCSATYLNYSGQVGGNNWRTASREPAGLAPDPATTPEAVVQVYAARAVRWRGYFGVHTWIAVKRSGATEFTIHEVNGHRLRRRGTVMVTSERAPDGQWYGNRPMLLKDVRGPGVD